MSLRTEPIVKPTVIDRDDKNIPFAVTHRLFPHFQKADYVVWGIDLQSVEKARIFRAIQDEYKNQKKFAPLIIVAQETDFAERLAACTQACWVVVPAGEADSLPATPLLESIRARKGQNYFSLTFADFSPAMPVPSVCETQRRLEKNCVTPLSVREAKRYLKRSRERSFFIRSYNNLDFFLFMQSGS